MTVEPAEKVRRQRLIRDIIKRRAVGSQDALGRALAERGVVTTQSTLSRDLRELGILRVPTGEGYRYVPSGGGALAAANGETERFCRVAAMEVLAVESNEQLVVVRTLAGRAQGVAVTIDQLALPEIIGTVAGDDTVLVVPSSVRRTRRLERRLRDVLGAA